LRSSFLNREKRNIGTIITSSILTLDEVVTALSTSRGQVHKIDPPSTLTEADVQRMLSDSRILPHKFDTEPFRAIINGVPTTQDIETLLEQSRSKTHVVDPSCIPKLEDIEGLLVTSRSLSHNVDLSGIPDNAGIKRLLDESRASDHSINLSSYPNTEKMKELLGMSRKEKHNVDLSLVPTIRTITKTLPTLAAIEAQFKNSNSSNKVLFTNIRQDVSFLGREIGQLLLKPSFDTLYELLEKGIEEQVEKSAERILQTITVDHWSEMKQHLTAEKAAILSGFKSEGSTKASNEDLNRLQGLMANMSKTRKQSRDEVSSLHQEVTTIKESKTNLD
jgi:hypothetical protein